MVIEDENERQFVVPFVCVDAKKIHLLLPLNKSMNDKKIGMFSNLTDNRYGQVMEKILDDNPISYNYYKYKANYFNTEVWFNEQEKDVAITDPVAFTDLDYPVIYYDKDCEREAIYISAIEPYIKRDQNVQNLNEIITSVICGKGISTQKPNCRIVSMRVYDEKCADISGNENTGGTWEERQKEIRENTVAKINQYGSIEQYLTQKYKNIVQYK